ncbi:MAG: DUF1653 domain-containing protein [Opitutaceae bacterium]
MDEAPLPFPLALLPAEPRAGRYRHYKGNNYQVLGLARHSETQEVLVVYKMLYGDGGIWVRPQSMFVSSVTLADSTVTPRFTYIGSA